MGLADVDVDDSRWTVTKTLSSPWSSQGIFAGGGVWYRVELPEMPKGPLGLMLGGCAGATRVYVNGAYVGEGRGFAKPMAFDLTDFAKPGAGNVLAVQVMHSGGEIGVGGLIYPAFVFAGPRLAQRAPQIDDSIRLLPGGAVERVRR